MEQNTQQTEQAGVENKLPIKTKIVARFLLMLGALILFFGLALETLAIFFSGDVPCSETTACAFSMMAGIVFCVVGGILTVQQIFILKKKKWAWWSFMIFSTIIFLLVIIWVFFYVFVDSGDFNDLESIIPLIISCFIGLPSIIFFLDRKNFWKVAR